MVYGVGYVRVSIVETISGKNFIRGQIQSDYWSSEIVFNALFVCGHCFVQYGLI